MPAKKDVRQKILSAVVGKKKRKRKLSASVKAYRKALRSAVAFLKKKKIIEPKVSARKNITSKSIKATVKRNADVLTKTRSTWKIPESTPPEIMDSLINSGYRIEGRGKSRVIILPKSQYISVDRKTSEVRLKTRKTRSRKSSELINIKLGPNVDDQVRDAFRDLKEGDYIGFSVDGHNSYSIYGTPESLMETLTQYHIYKDRKISALTVFRVGNPDRYMADGRTRMQARDEARRKRDSQRRRERRALRAGMRVTRGN